MMRSHRVYTRQEVCELLAIPRRSFYHHLRNGQLPMVEELKPRIGRICRYRADLIDRYVAGEWTYGGRHFLASPRRPRTLGTKGGAI